MKKHCLSFVLLLCCAGTAQAQLRMEEKNFVIPQFVDGRFTDGTYYRSTLMVQQFYGTPSISCTFRLSGMTANFVGGASGSAITFNVPPQGWAQVKTTGTQTFQSGYGALSCSDYVYANVLYSFYNRDNVKIGEATVFGVSPVDTMRVIADQTEGARLGIAIANDTDAQRTYTILLRRSDGSTAGTTTVVVPARRSLSRFLTEIISTSANQILEAEVFAADFSLLSVVGLRFTGETFSTIPANW